jgi:hypothetical protein
MNGPATTFRLFHRATSGLAGTERQRIFEQGLSEQERREAFATLGNQLEGQRLAEDQVAWPTRKTPPPPMAVVRHLRPRGAPPVRAGGDVLDEISPRDYFAAIVGEEVPF